MSETVHTRRIHIVNKKGLHARASAALAKLAMTFDAAITVTHGAHSANARSIMDLMMLVAHRGAEIEVSVSGPDAAQAMTAVSSLIGAGFGELADDYKAEDQLPDGKPEIE